MFTVSFASLLLNSFSSSLKSKSHIIHIKKKHSINPNIYLISVKPKAWVHNQLVGAPLGHDVTIECVIEAFPKAITYWQKTKNGKEKIIMNGYGKRIYNSVLIVPLNLPGLNSEWRRTGLATRPAPG